jgi:hypothetical protein
MEQFKAHPNDWKYIEIKSEDPTCSVSFRGIRELRDRVAALEAKQAGFTMMPAPLPPGFSMMPGLPPLPPHPTADAPSDEDLWELRRATQQGRTSITEFPGWSHINPSNWVTRAEIYGNRALFDAGVAHAAARAEQQAVVKESLTAEPSPADPGAPQSLHDVALAHVDTLGRSFGILPAILDTIRRAIREPMAAPAEPGRVATDEELREAWELAPAPGGIFNSNYCLRAVYNLGRQHGAACPYIRSSDEGTSYCALAEQPAPAAPAPDPAPPAPAGRLVKVLLDVEEDWSETEIRELIHGTAMWLQCVGFENSANLLRKEANR